MVLFIILYTVPDDGSKVNWNTLHVIYLLHNIELCCVCCVLFCRVLFCSYLLRQLTKPLNKLARAL
jgi:hypothetical protein